MKALLELMPTGTNLMSFTDEEFHYRNLEDLNSIVHVHTLASDAILNKLEEDISQHQEGFAEISEKFQGNKSQALQS